MANHPVTGLKAGQITGYISWLNELTGQTYRLPNLAEGKKLHKTAKTAATKENTLNHWAGYDIPLNEVVMLQQKVAEVKSTLLKPAGSFKATKVGKAKVYDLGGNAAEYCQDGDTMQTYGYSAYDYVDPADNTHEAAPGHTGFRIVLAK